MNCAPAPSKRLSTALAAFDAAGVELTRDELVWLAQLAYVADRPIEGGVPYVAAAPVKYGGQTFWPMHRLAMHWYSRWYPMFEGDELMQVCMLGFAHTRSMVGDESLLELSDPESVAVAVSDWADTCAIHDVHWPLLYDRLQQLNGMEPVVPHPDAKDKEDEPASMYADIALLCKAFPGTTPRYWRSGISFAESQQLLNDMQDDGDHKRDIKNKAIASFRNACKWIMHWHGKADEGEE